MPVKKVEVGFSWQAFFVGSFRTFVKRSWPVLCLLPVAYFVFARKDAALPSSSRLSALLAANAVVGFSTYGEQYQAMHVNQTFTGIAIGYGAQHD